MSGQKIWQCLSEVKEERQEALTSQEQTKSKGKKQRRQAKTQGGLIAKE